MLLLFIFVVCNEANILNCTEETLYEWCYSDIECRKLFHQHDHKNLDTFNYVLKTCVNKRELQKSYDSWSEDSKKHLWLTNMKLWAYRSQRNIHCPPNKKLVYNKHGTPSCMCKPDRSCDESEESEPFLWVVAITSLLLLVILFIGSCCCKDKWPPMPFQSYPPHLQYESHHYEEKYQQPKQQQQQQTKNKFVTTTTTTTINPKKTLTAAEARDFYKN